MRTFKLLVRREKQKYPLKPYGRFGYQPTDSCCETLNPPTSGSNAVKPQKA